MGTTTILVRDILAFHTLDRTLYDRVLSYGRTPAAARNIIALWMYLEIIGINVILYVTGCHNPTVVKRFVTEAEAILNVVRPDPTSVPISTAIPFTSSLVREPLTLGFFYRNSGMLVKGVARLLDGVGRYIFDDSLKVLIDACRSVEMKARLAGRWEMPLLPPQLAQPYESMPAAGPEDCRTLFVTFSWGFALSLGGEDVVEYFVQKWGECIEQVSIEQTPETVLPMYGRVVFTSESCLDLVLGGEEVIKFVIKGHYLWARQGFPQCSTAGF